MPLAFAEILEQAPNSETRSHRKGVAAHRWKYVTRVHDMPHHELRTEDVGVKLDRSLRE